MDELFGTELAFSATTLHDHEERDTSVRHEASRSFEIPSDCPFSIDSMNEDKTLFLVREQDKFRDYPNIYARIIYSPEDTCTGTTSKTAKFIVLCDTGSGTNMDAKGVAKNELTSKSSFGKLPVPALVRSGNWNIRTLLEATINPDGRLPYLIITSHCHYDHILGIAKLPRSAVLSSAYSKSFLTPRSNLAKNSGCNDLGLSLPNYKIDIWAEDFQEVIYKAITTGITILQTPGHTPDSLTWYDSTLSPPRIFVGDCFYERQSEVTKTAKWGREPPMPTIFSIDSDLADWTRSMKKMTNFVRERNAELAITADQDPESDWVLVSQEETRDRGAPRVMLGAAHVTVSVDAMDCLLGMRDFMRRVIQDDVAHCRMKDEDGHEVWLWDDLLDVDHERGFEAWPESNYLGRFSVQAPLFLIEKERERRKMQYSRSFELPLC